MSDSNLDSTVVKEFGEEWNAFDQDSLSEAEVLQHFNLYFSVFPWQMLTPLAEGFDAGCGSGRWAKVVASRVGHLHCIEPSLAVEVAKKKLSGIDNCSFHQTTIGAMPIDDASMDFGYSLGVLHHMPDTLKGMQDCVRKLKPGAPFLIYIYYAFDNQPGWFKTLWKISNMLRKIVSILPFKLKKVVTTVIAATVYFPLARTADLVERLGGNVHSFPLSTYRKRSFYSMKTDALDRFGTRLEKRFTKKELISMMESSGLVDIVVSDSVPFYCACGIKA